MKAQSKIILAICSITAAALLSPRLTAQFVAGPIIKSFVTNDSTVPFIAVGGGTAPGPSTNLSGLGVQNIIPVGRNGWSLGVLMAGTNATTTTNVTFTFEYSYNGTDFATNNFTTVIWTPLGVNYAPVFTNNPATDAAGVMGNVAAVRLRSIHHTNTGSIFITNIVAATR